MTKWEYKIIHIDLREDYDLNFLGSKGWELIYVETKDGDISSILKRKIEDDDPQLVNHGQMKQFNN